CITSRQDGTDRQFFTLGISAGRAERTESRWPLGTRTVRSLTSVNLLRVIARDRHQIMPYRSASVTARCGAFGHRVRRRLGRAAYCGSKRARQIGQGHLRQLQKIAAVQLSAARRQLRSRTDDAGSCAVVLLRSPTDRLPHVNHQGAASCATSTGGLWCPTRGTERSRVARPEETSANGPEERRTSMQATRCLGCWVLLVGMLRTAHAALAQVVVIDLGTLGPGTATAVSNSGQVVGCGIARSGETHPFSWTAAGGI